jgi:hypothetical protein
MEPAAPAAAAAAAAASWSCHVHGPLPLSDFAAEDLGRHRHRCKRCLAAKMSVYRARKPLRHMWLRFVQRARGHFSCSAADDLSWAQHGQTLLSRLIAGRKADAQPLQHYKLVWTPGVQELDLQRVQLALKQSKRKPAAAALRRDF